VPTGTKQQDLDRLRADIKKFKKDNDLTTVIVLWTANTERFTDVRPGLNTTAAEVFVISIKL
jgi:myo-inositol-1-phosphate synthase